MAKILLAEDDTALRGFLSASLEKAGHNVVACEDGLMALAVLEAEEGTFDLLLSDIIMPGIDGIELSQRALRINPALKVLFITGFAAMALSDAPSGDAPRVISKPFHLGKLVREIEEILGS